MSQARRLLPPSGSLPGLRTLNQLPESCILSALGDLSALYCPLPTSLSFQTNSAPKDPLATIDSGYASDNEDDDLDEAGDAGFELRDDAHERAFAERWLTGFLGCVEELTCFQSEESRDRAVERASRVLASFYGQVEAEDEQTEITRDYHFKLNPVFSVLKVQEETTVCETLTVQLTDGLAGRDSTDHKDVGLQSWGAGFIFSELMCASPARFDFSEAALGCAPRIVELGAGTGLVGIALGKILPRLGVTRPTIIATDFHPNVLANLRNNVDRNFTTQGTAKEAIVEVAPLDWETPDLSAPLDKAADLLVATDVIYEHEQAVWLRDCASQMLKPDGVFWLMLTVRTTGKFEGIASTARAAFNGRDGPKNAEGQSLMILDEERFARPNGIGRGDESEYRLFKIGWA
ncbi:putative methyltransferase-domain-containing protein [Xylariaceae sp. FL1019]|nr:putative methyltransferase-domain-containing protein [Xylariaceae sp. FL1019]